MVCSRYFSDDELPADIVVVRQTQREFWRMIYASFSEADKAVVDARPDFEKTKVWFVDATPRVRYQPLLRNVGEPYWGANDVNPPWLRKAGHSPWFATEAAANDYLTTLSG